MPLSLTDLAVVSSQHPTRESWLNAFTAAARPHFDRVGFPLPSEVRSSIGFPSKGARSKVIGECWSNAVSEDGHFEIFLRPSMQSDASRIADVLTHELVHAAVGLEAKHGRKFAKCATALGLTGKMTATVAGPEWHVWADPILASLGPLPGAALGDLQLSSGGKKQTTRMLKLECDQCGFSCRTTAKHIEAHEDGLTCPVPDCDGNLQRS
ncbi:hypothetical protein BSL82_03755 [Tardibacter chloracetimidivorans]|uniref:Uncharacterized protein n=1 Tax=Tardibacter chloracetimidivorans TaxID=1921510 RepID=A0A1L3ZSD1_9SPHN|nr:SprT-like domain-containing protein [Tardibacter chloracetimidivorans]API58532.1 hypothetical protein BSL82_03755 [Tardibacter chloracetimidivorans]